MEHGKTSDDIRQRFGGIKTLSKAVSYVKSMGLCHSWYCHYTNLEALKQIITTGKLRLTCADSLMFDDTLEQKRFGDIDVRRRMFFACFSHERAESAAMWGLYCPPTYKAVRIVFHRNDLSVLQKEYRRSENWITGVVKGYPMFSDIVYAGQLGSQVEANLSNHVFWGSFVSDDINGFSEKKFWPQVTGFVKDYEWHFEKETRFFLKTKDVFGKKHYDIDFPISKMNRHTVEITLSPWADDDEIGYIKAQISQSVGECKCPQSIKCVRSTLSKGLGKWATKRGV